MSYLELQELKSLIKKFANNKANYDITDITYKMKQEILENMAIISYRDLLENSEKTMEQIIVERIEVMLNFVKIIEYKKENFIKLDDLKFYLNKIKEEKLIRL